MQEYGFREAHRNGFRTPMCRELAFPRTLHLSTPRKSTMKLKNRISNPALAIWRCSVLPFRRSSPISTGSMTRPCARPSRLHRCCCDRPERWVSHLATSRTRKRLESRAWSIEHKAQCKRGEIFLYEIRFKPQRAVLAPSILHDISAGALPRMIFKLSFQLFPLSFPRRLSLLPAYIFQSVIKQICHVVGSSCGWRQDKDADYSSITECSQKRKSHA